MADTSLTTFVDFVSKAGTPKLTVVRQDKARREEKYNPATDYYRILREGIVEMHSEGRDGLFLQNLQGYKANKSKINTYPLLINSYLEWLKGKAVSWFTPPRGVWSEAGLNVAINPELGLKINGAPHVLKLYFKEDALIGNRADLITHLMEMQRSANWPKGSVPCVLDVRKGKLHVLKKFNKDIEFLLRAEAGAWMQIWESLS